MAAINGKTRYISTISWKNRDCEVSVELPITRTFSFSLWRSRSRLCFGWTCTNFHSFVSSRITCSNVSCKLLWSFVHIFCWITSVKETAVSSVPVFPLLPITSRLVKKHKLKACLDSGIRNAYTTGLTKELKKKYMKKVTRKMLLVILYPRKTIRL